jgi:RNA polymerase sigma-70 factor (sigma-E family)
VSVRLGSDFDTFVLAASPTLLRTALLLTGDRGHAEDLLQTALLRTARRWPAAREQPTAYARRVLINLAKDRGRALSRRPPESLGNDLSSLTQLDQGDPLAEAELRQALMTAVRRLPMPQRTVLVLRYFEDLSVDETAAAMGCSPGTVKSQAHAAIAALRGHLDAAPAEHDDARLMMDHA